MEQKQLFGTMPSGEDIYLCTIQNEALKAKILTLGGILQSLYVCERDVVAGFDSLEDYLADDSLRAIVKLKNHRIPEEILKSILIINLICEGGLALEIAFA